MTVTAPALAAQGRGRLPAPVRDRRPALAALALLLVLGGALTSALLAYRSGDRVDVLVARTDIELGQQVSEADFTVARVASDDDAATIESAAAANFVGTAATTRIPAGTLLNRAMFVSGNLQPVGTVVVGVVLGPTQRPAGALRAGDIVRVFAVPRDGGAVEGAGGAGPVGTVLASAVKIAEPPELVGDDLRLSLLAPENNASTLIGAAASGSVAVTKLASETKPAVDFQTEG